MALDVEHGSLARRHLVQVHDLRAPSSPMNSRHHDLSVARTGETITRTFRAIVYTGFHGAAVIDSAEDSRAAQVMMIVVTGATWKALFTGGYD